jgi:hypothetical protein
MDFILFLETTTSRSYWIIQPATERDYPITRLNYYNWIAIDNALFLAVALPK